MTLKEELRDFIADFLGVLKTEVVPEASFIDDLGADSVDLAGMFMRLEEKLDIDIPVEEAARLVTVQNVIDYIVSDGEVDLSQNGRNLFLSGKSTQERAARV